MPIIRRRRVRQSLIWIAALILFLSSAAMLAIFVILPFAFDLRVMLGPMQAAILGLATSSALALLILDWIHSRRQKQENKDAWLTDEHVNLMISGLEDYAIFFLDSDGTVISWNNGAAKIKGYQSDEILGQNFSVFYTEEDIAEGLPNQNLKKALEKGKLRAEGWRLRKDGTRFRADVLITPYHDEQENLKAYAKITRDISRWYDVHTRLEESERQLEEAQRVAHIGSWEWDLENDELSWSKELKRIYGRDLESFQPTIEAYLDSIPDEERDRVAKTIDRSFETGEPLELEHRIVRPDGEIRTIYARGQVQIDAEGKPIRLHGIGQDITDRVHLERSYLIQAELNQIVVRAQSDLGQGVLIIEDGLILFSNDALQEIFEIPGEVIESVDQFLALVELDETSNLGRILTATPLEMGRLHRGNQFVNGENGKHFEFAATSMQVDHHSRRVVLIQDITERRELQLMLEESREKLRRYSAELNRAVEEERATISRRIHDELGQQLTGLRMDLSAMYSRASDSNHPDLLY
ncbi:MAG: PAS domain S-box protein, partial [Anaerolineales bacterium]